ncbi:MAG: DUF4129 domain-containing protein [Streptosporangiales bacterium]
MVPIDVGRDEARRAAQHELEKAVYHAHEPGPLERLRQELMELIGRLLHAADGTNPSGWVGLLIIVLLVIGIILLVRHRAGRIQRNRRRAREGVLDETARRTAAEHRAAAVRHAAEEDWAEAIRDRMRAIALSLEERALLDHRPGRTADEIARDAGERLPGLVEELRAAARTFDDVWYGGHTATRAEYDRITAVDERVREAKPVLDSADRS